MRSITSTRSFVPVPMHLRNQQQRRVPEIAAQLRAVGRLAGEVELVAQRLLEFGDDLARLQAAAVGGQALDQPGGGVHQGKVVVDDRVDVRAQHLHRDRRAVGQLREMHLRDRCARHRLRVEAREDLRDGLAVAPLERSPRPRRPETAAPGPAASRARRRCRSAAGRGVSTAPARISRRSARASRARGAGGPRAAFSGRARRAGGEPTAGRPRAAEARTGGRRGRSAARPCRCGAGAGHACRHCTCRKRAPRGRARPTPRDNQSGVTTGPITSAPPEIVCRVLWESRPAAGRPAPAPQRDRAIARSGGTRAGRRRA